MNPGVSRDRAFGSRRPRVKRRVGQSEGMPIACAPRLARAVPGKGSDLSRCAQLERATVPATLNSGFAHGSGRGLRWDARIAQS
jgi:hypothetical protein